MTTQAPRFTELQHWLSKDLGLVPMRIEPASSDASFRRYFRVAEKQSYIVMDAPPPMENIEPFIKVAGILGAVGVNVPQVHAADLERGFALLSDLGHETYLDQLDGNTVERLYLDALAVLKRMQKHVVCGVGNFPLYDDTLLMRELNIFREWFIEAFLGLHLEEQDLHILGGVWEKLIASALEQPRVFVHRDFHSRNLMFTQDRNPGVLDFQDAVEGPLTYDAVSLLRDCYIDWPEDRVDRWANQFSEDLVKEGLLPREDRAKFPRWFDLMGMQRHIKAIGIFARLNVRDGKAGYLKDIPRTFGYVYDVGRRYPEFAKWVELLEKKIRPLLETKL